MLLLSERKVRYERDLVSFFSDVERNKKYAQEDRLYEKETKLLRHRLKVYFYAAVKYKDHICSFQAIYFMFMLLQMLKVGLITAQVGFSGSRVEEGVGWGGE